MTEEEKKPKLKLGTMSAYQKEAAVTDVEFDRIAVDQRGVLMLLSAITETQKAKSLRAILSRGGSSRVQVQAAGVRVRRPGDPEWDARALGNVNICKCPDGYTSYVHRLPYGMAHIVLVGRTEGLMPVADEIAIWNEIKDSRFTTPVVPEWMPWIKQELVSRKLLAWCHGYRAECAILQCSDEHLDRIVSDGLRAGSIVIPRDEDAIDTELLATTGSLALPAPAEVA